jgi:glucose-6-phosphate 1-dehydrogenase
MSSFHDQPDEGFELNFSQNGSDELETGFQNPLRESSQSGSPEPCILVIFGASGDLTGRKLIPALFNMMKEGQLPPNFVCVGFARRPKSDESFRAEMADHIKKFSRLKGEDSEINEFVEKLFYHASDFEDDGGYESLKTSLKELDKRFGTSGNRIFYLSVQPSSHLPIVEHLKKHGLIYDLSNKTMFSRVIIEKPFGHDLQSAITLQESLTHHLSEEQIYRIDHYLGKETVQNLLVFRFSNGIFEGLWNNRYVDNIQITVAESIGIEGRGAFYEGSGLLRDVVQNHLMQLLSLVTMEPPSNLSPKAIRDEKVKAIQAIRPFSLSDLENSAFRGQYTNGFIEGEPVIAYRKEPNVNPLSNVETFGSLRLEMENWRWSGVPIYIRAGKRLPKRTTELVVTFKRTPTILFHKNDKHNIPNQLIFRIQPDEGTSIKFNSKVPGSTNTIQPVMMDFSYANYFGKEVPEAYERLIYDCMLGDNTLFARVDESLTSWQFFTPILDYWASKPLSEEEFYPAGTLGPMGADFLLRREHRSWKPL